MPENRNIGSIPYDRNRDAEFAERTHIPRHELLSIFDDMVAKAEQTFDTLTIDRLGAASPEPRMFHNLRVDDHADPVAELRRIWEVVAEHTRQIEREYGPAAVRLFGRIKH